MNRGRSWLNNSFVRNGLWFAAALSLATLVWAFAVLEDDPVGSRNYLNVDIQFLHDPNLILIDPSAENARVTVTAQESSLRLLSPSEIVLRADFTGLEPGQHTVDLESSVARRAIVDTQPRTVTAVLEAVQAQQIEVVTAIDEPPPVGYELAEPIQFSPSQVMISGPASLVEQVVAARVEVDLSEQRSPFEADFRPVPVDVDGRVISDLEIEPMTVNASIVVNAEENVDVVGVVPDIDRDSIAEGYEVRNIDWNPRTVLVSGTPDQREALPGLLLTEQISLRNRTEDFTVTVPVNFPEDVPRLPLIGQQAITVMVEVEALPSTRRFDNVPVTVTGLTDEMIVETVPEEVIVFVEGPEVVLSSLNISDIRVQVDVTGRVPGTYEMDPMITVPTAPDAVVDVQPETIIVTVSQVEPEATPTVNVNN
jgi:YbbR domain-containing protein